MGLTRALVAGVGTKNISSGRILEAAVALWQSLPLSDEVRSGTGDASADRMRPVKRNVHAVRLQACRYKTGCGMDD
jgi:hypothetical protein